MDGPRLRASRVLSLLMAAMAIADLVRRALGHFNSLRRFGASSAFPPWFGASPRQARLHLLANAPSTIGSEITQLRARQKPPRLFGSPVGRPTRRRERIGIRTPGPACARAQAARTQYVA